MVALEIAYLTSRRTDDRGTILMIQGMLPIITCNDDISGEPPEAVKIARRMLAAVES